MATYKLDFLTSEFALGVNSIPDKRNPGLIAFAVCVARATLLSLLALVVLYFLGFAVESAGHFNAQQLTVFMIAFVLFEEQGRWIFASSAEQPRRACIVFLLAIVSVESIGFYLGSRTSLFNFILLRFGSIMVHSINALICLASIRKPFLKKLAYFSAAIALHTAMNMGVSERLGTFLISTFS